jgi:hypothetical protein
MSAPDAWRAQIRAEALAAGYSVALAEFIAREVGRDTAHVLAGDERPGAHRAALARARAVAPAAGDYLARICGLFHAPLELVGELRTAGVSLRTVTSMLTAATGTARAISTAGCERVRLQLMARKGTAL